MNKSILLAILLLISTTININSDDSNNKIQSDWIKYNIAPYGFTPFTIDLPQSYGIRIGKRETNVMSIWATHEIIYNNRQIGGIFVGNFEPDYVLWGINENELKSIPINIFNSDCQIKLFTNIDGKILPNFPYRTNDKYVFEACILNYSGKKDEIYFYIWGKTNDDEILNDLLKVFSSIKNN